MRPAPQPADRPPRLVVVAGDFAVTTPPLARRRSGRSLPLWATSTSGHVIVCTPIAQPVTVLGHGGLLEVMPCRVAVRATALELAFWRSWVGLMIGERLGVDLPLALWPEGEACLDGLITLEAALGVARVLSIEEGRRIALGVVSWLQGAD